MAVPEMNRLRNSYRKRNQDFLKYFLENYQPNKLIFEEGDLVSGERFADDAMLYIQEGHCVRSLIDSQGNYQAVLMAGPIDIIGLSTRFNQLIIPGGAHVIERLMTLEIPNTWLLEWAKEDPMLLYENMQYEVMMANTSIRMNGMTKKEKIYYILIELLKDNYIVRGDSLQFKKHVTQEVIAQFSGVSKSYVSRILCELKDEEIFNPYHVELVCDNPEALIKLSAPHCDFTIAEIFSMVSPLT